MSLPAIGPLPGERRGYGDVSGHQFHYREMGEGPAVVLLHQAPWASIQYRRILPLVAAAGYRALAPDLPGHGLSDPLDPPTIERFAATVPALLDALDIERAALVGQHGGALVAARAAAEMKLRASALVMDNCPLHAAGRRRARLASIDESHFAKPDGEHWSDRWNLVRRIGDPGWSDETVHVAVLTYFANGPTREHLHRAAATYDITPDLARIECPVQVMAGRTDTLFDCAAPIMALRPDWHYHEYAGGSAELFERPEAWTAAVLGFVGKALGGRIKKGFDLP